MEVWKQYASKFYYKFQNVWSAKRFIWFVLKTFAVCVFNLSLKTPLKKGCKLLLNDNHCYDRFKSTLVGKMLVLETVLFIKITSDTKISIQTKKEFLINILSIQFMKRQKYLVLGLGERKNLSVIESHTTYTF